MGGFAQGGAQTLARHFQQAKTGNAANLHPGAVGLDRVTQAGFHFTLVLGRSHIDKIDDYQATDIANT
jgi:hypothetical protein